MCPPQSLFSLAPSISLCTLALNSAAGVPAELDGSYCVLKRPVSFTFLLDSVTLKSTMEVLSHCKSFS